MQTFYWTDSNFKNIKIDRIKFVQKINILKYYISNTWGFGVLGIAGLFEKLRKYQKKSSRNKFSDVSISKINLNTRGPVLIKKKLEEYQVS